AIGKPDTGNIDAAIAATNQAIMNALQDDLIDGNGKFFNPETGTTDTEGNATGYDEPYDYPCTNGDVKNRKSNSKLTGELFDNIVGGKNDDTWLASSEPDTIAGNNDEVTWPHITDLTGVYLRWDNYNSDADAGALHLDASNLPYEYPVETTDAND